jgi:hypothetical protein
MTVHHTPEGYKDAVVASDRSNRRFWRRDLIGYALLLLAAVIAAMFLPRTEHKGTPHPSAIEAPAASQTGTATP